MANTENADIKRDPAVDSSDLLPCPFCGEPAIGLTWTNESAVGCSNEECAICPVTDNQPTRQQAKEIWNGRGDQETRECAEIGAKWRKNSSLEEWFPFSAQKLKSLEAEVGSAASIIVKQNQEIEILRSERREQQEAAKQGNTKLFNP